MNTTAPFASASPVLRLPSRAESAGGGSGVRAANPRPSFDADLEAMREREANLRAYEERLRAWQAQLDARASAAGGTGSTVPFARPPSRTPFAGDTELEAAWGKLHRAHALLEAEQNQLRDDRMAVREMEKQLKVREAELAAREARCAARERPAAEARPAGAAPKREDSAVARLTTAPFRAAKAIFRSAG